MDEEDITIPEMIYSFYRVLILMMFASSLYLSSVATTYMMMPLQTIVLWILFLGLLIPSGIYAIGEVRRSNRTKLVGWVFYAAVLTWFYNLPYEADDWFFDFFWGFYFVSIISAGLQFCFMLYYAWDSVEGKTKEGFLLFRPIKYTWKGFFG